MSLISDGALEKTDELEESQLYNADLAPVPIGQRKWRIGSIAALWLSMAAGIPTYKHA